MQVACPHCGTQYNLTARQIGPAGRTLQCAKCKYKWFVAPAATPVAVAATEALPPLPPPVAPDLDELASIGSTPGWWRRVRVGWGPELTLTAAGIGVAVLAIFSFNWVLHYSTNTAFAPSTPGITTHQPGPQPSGLVLSNLSREVAQRGGNMVLVIHGALTNTTSSSATLPDLRVQLLDREGVELDYWPVSYTSPQLQPGQTTTWQVTFVNPPLPRVAAFRAFFTGGGTAVSAATPLDSKPGQE